MVTSLNAAWTSSSSADWDTTVNSIVVSSGDPGVTLDPSSVIADLDAYILEEGLFKTKLQAEQSENEQNLGDNQNSLDDATTAFQDAQTNATNATTTANAAAASYNTALASETSLLTSYNNATDDVADILSDDQSIDVNDANTHTQAYIDAISAESTAKDAYDAALLQTDSALALSNDANDALNTATSGVADAQNTVDALNTTRSTLQQRTGILQTEIQNIDNRVIDADNAKTTIANAFDSKEESYTDIITLLNSLVDNDFSEDLEASLDTLANTPTNDLDIINPVETTINGSVLDHNDEDNLTNEVLSG
jgi:chromosome segregation ATPase